MSRGCVHGSLCFVYWYPHLEILGCELSWTGDLFCSCGSMVFRFHNYGLWINSLWLWFSCVGISDGHSNWVRSGLNGIVIMCWQLYLELWLYIFLLHFRLFSSCGFLIFSVEDSWHDREQVLFPLQTRTTLQEKSARHCPWTTPLTTTAVMGAQGEDRQAPVGGWVEGSVPQGLVVLAEALDKGEEEGEVRGTSASSCLTAVSDLIWVFLSLTSSVTSA